MLSSKLLATQKPSEVVEPDGVSFDGVTDYLSRSTDLVGNVDSKTFTFSDWVYLTDSGDDSPAIYWQENGLIQVTYVKSTGTFTFTCYNSTPSIVLNIQASGNHVALNTYNNILVSVDLADTNKRHIYIQDRVISPTWSTYTNDFIKLTRANHYIASSNGTTQRIKGRLSHLFLDYTYRDLSIEANRRLFITDDGKPADGLASLNPILYLPMKDAETAHINLGTGGDFVQNGVLDTASRGANQDNCVASEFDGSDDYLSRSSTGSFDSRYLTFSMNVTSTPNKTGHIIQGPFGQFSISYVVGLPKLRISLYSAAISNYVITGVVVNEDLSDVRKTYVINFVIDSQNPAQYLLFVNGVRRYMTVDYVARVATSFTYTNSAYAIGASTGANTFLNGNIGELYFDTNYIDLATNNPFWDSDTNKPIPVRKAMETLGSTPLICMPISADNPGKNYGTGGDFTLNGGGLVGARGASEYISRSILVDATKYLTGSIFCQSLVKWKSTDAGATWTVTYLNATTVTKIGNGTDNGVVSYYFGFSDNINWTLEENKNMVTDQLGYPKEPSSVIKNSGWSPVLGLFFNDTANFGLNIYGDNFTQTGVITAGADVKK